MGQRGVYDKCEYLQLVARIVAAGQRRQYLKLSFVQRNETLGCLNINIKHAV